MMKKTFVFILIGGLVIGGIGAGAYLYVSNPARSTKPGEVAGKAEMTPTPTPKLVPWDDPAGFTMQYPEGLTLNKHEEDVVNYAHVELTDAAHPGGLIVWVKDIPAGVTDTASWGKKAATPSSAISFDTILGSQSAQKILVSGPEKTVAVGVVYDGVLWYVESKLTDEQYWQSVFDAVVQSFTFKPVTPQAGNGNQAGGGANTGVTEEEEVLE